MDLDARLSAAVPPVARALLLACLLGASLPAIAGPIDFSVDEGMDLFGNVDQTALGDVLGGCGCGPVAAVNSFVYLERRFPGQYGTSLTPLDRVGEEKIAGDLALNWMHTSDKATTIQNFINGKMDYIDENAPFTTNFAAQVSPRLEPGTFEGSRSTEFVEPTAAFLAGELRDGEDVEVLIAQFDEKGVQTFGHFVTAVKLDWINQKGDGFMAPSDGATWGFMDPNGGVVRDKRFIFESDGELMFQGPSGGTFEIVAIVSESPFRKTPPIPEPQTWRLLLAGLGALGASRALGRVALARRFAMP